MASRPAIGGSPRSAGRQPRQWLAFAPTRTVWFRPLAVVAHSPVWCCGQRRDSALRGVPFAEQSVYRGTFGPFMWPSEYACAASLV